MTIITNAKREISCHQAILDKYCLQDSEHSDQTKKQFWTMWTTNRIGKLTSLLTDMEILVNPGWQDIFTRKVSDFMFHQLLAVANKSSNSSQVGITQNQLSLLIYLGALNGLLAFMSQWKPSKTDLCTMLDTIRQQKTSTE